MDKISLGARLRSKNDYSIFAFEKPEFRKYPLQDYTDTTFTSDYHRAKLEQTIQLFRKLNGLTVAEYFTYQPHLIDRLRISSLTEADNERDVSDMTIGEVMSYIGILVDKDQEFDLATTLCLTLMETIKDSMFTHPLYSSLFIHNQEMVRMLTDGKRGDYDPDTRHRLYQSMNDRLRKRDPRLKSRDLSRRFGNDDDGNFGSFFNNIVIPSIVVRNNYH